MDDIMQQKNSVAESKLPIIVLSSASELISANIPLCRSVIAVGFSNLQQWKWSYSIVLPHFGTQYSGKLSTVYFNYGNRGPFL